MGAIGRCGVGGVFDVQEVSFGSRIMRANGVIANTGRQRVVYYAPGIFASPFGLGYLGDATTSDVGSAVSVAGAGLAIASAAGLTATIAGLSVIPIAGPILAVGALIFSLFHDSQSGQQKVLTTEEVNKVEPYMQQNVNAWKALPSGEKTPQAQQAALNNFDQLWAGVVQYCSNSQLGDPGKRCIDDRSGTRNGGNGKYDWFAYYRDDIANDPQVQANVVAAQAALTAQAAQNAASAQAAQSQSSSVSLLPAGTDVSKWIFPAALIVLGLLAGGDR